MNFLRALSHTKTCQTKGRGFCYPARCEVWTLCVIGGVGTMPLLMYSYKWLVFHLQLEREGLLAKGVVLKNSEMEKRGRWQGFCFRRTRSGRFLPYICWKGGEGECK